MYLRQAIEDWINEQSPTIQALARRFPPGSRIIDVARVEYFVLDYFEDGSLGITDVPPGNDLQSALQRSWCVSKESVSMFRQIGNG
jgi:hypothetical protein